MKSNKQTNKCVFDDMQNEQLHCRQKENGIQENVVLNMTYMNAPRVKLYTGGQEVERPV